MTVSIDTTSRKYHGRMAETYETKRKKQQRWHEENDTVRQMLNKLRPRSVLDVPCGTGRYFELYDALRVKRVIAVDVSDAMLDIARKKTTRHAHVSLICKDVRKLKVKTVDVSVCMRFLDLIDEPAMRSVLVKLFAVSSRAIICTIRLGESYVPKSNTATHDERKFRALLKKHGWKIAKDQSVFTQGWHIFLLKPQA
jgi:SAM-dependent methyltransferase